MKILAAIVTYNRCELLSRCLDYIERQQRTPDKIIVINNSSTDNTEEMLRKRGVEFITQENSGSAGGWHSSIDYAIKNSYDAIWLMDDDGYPDIEALGRLERELCPGISCASSIVLQEDQPSRFVFPMPKLDRHDEPVIAGLPRKFSTVYELAAAVEKNIYPFAHLFNGALISVGVCKIIGNVNQAYFIFGDEVDYFCRMRRVGSVISVIDAHHYHPDVSKRPLSTQKIYYYIKNTIIINKTYFRKSALRNCMTVLAIIGRTVHRNGLKSGLSLVIGRDSHMFYRAIIRGLQKKIGKDFYA